MHSSHEIARPQVEHSPDSLQAALSKLLIYHTYILGQTAAFCGTRNSCSLLIVSSNVVCLLPVRLVRMFVARSMDCRMMCCSTVQFMPFCRIFWDCKVLLVMSHQQCYSKCLELSVFYRVLFASSVLTLLAGCSHPAKIVLCKKSPESFLCELIWEPESGLNLWSQKHSSWVRDEWEGYLMFFPDGFY